MFLLCESFLDKFLIFNIIQQNQFLLKIGIGPKKFRKNVFVNQGQTYKRSLKEGVSYIQWFQLVFHLVLLLQLMILTEFVTWIVA